MRFSLPLFITKCKLSVKTIVWLLSQWRYLLLALIISVLFFEIIFWMFNLSILTVILTSGNLSILEKFDVLASPIKTINGTSGIIIVILMLIISVIQGINITALTYTIRHQKKADSKLIGSSSLVSLLAIIGLGCPACGTSLLTPIFAIFLSGSAVAFSEQITTIALPLAVIIGIYGLYSIGTKAANARMHRLQRIQD